MSSGFFSGYSMIDDGRISFGKLDQKRSQLFISAYKVGSLIAVEIGAMTSSDGELPRALDELLGLPCTHTMRCSTLRCLYPVKRTLNVPRNQ